MFDLTKSDKSACDSMDILGVCPILQIKVIL